MIDTILLLATSLLLLWIGLRVGAVSAIMLLAVHNFVGFFLRYEYLSAVEQPGFTFWRVMTGKFEVPMTLIAFEVSMGLLAVSFGYVALSQRSRIRASNTLFRPLEVPANTRIIWASITLIGFCWAIFLAGLVDYYGSVGVAFLNLQRRAITFTSTIVILRMFLTIGFAAVACMIYATYRLKNTGQIRLLVFAVAAGHLIGIFLTGGRGAMLTQLFVLYLIAGFAKQQVHLALKAKTVIYSILGAVTVVGVIILGFTMRLMAQRGYSFDFALSEVTPNIMSILSGTFPLYDLYSASHIYTTQEGYTFGSNYLNIATRFIPRSIWPDKPHIMGLEMRDLFYGDKLSGVPPTALGEMYLTAGFVGMLLLCVVFGMLVRVIDQARQSALVNPGFIVLYFYLIFQIALGVYKSGFENSGLHMIYFIVGILMVKGLAKFAFKPRTWKIRI